MTDNIAKAVEIVEVLYTKHDNPLEMETSTDVTDNVLAIANLTDLDDIHKLAIKEK